MQRSEKAKIAQSVSHRERGTPISFLPPMHLPRATWEVVLCVEAVARPQVLKSRFLVLVTKLVRSTEKRQSRHVLSWHQMKQEQGRAQTECLSQSYPAALLWEPFLTPQTQPLPTALGETQQQHRLWTCRVAAPFRTTAELTTDPCSWKGNGTNPPRACGNGVCG